MRHAVVLTHNRPDQVRQTLTQIAPQCDRVLVLDNASWPPLDADYLPPNVRVWYDDTQPPNLAALWNRGLDAVANWETGSDRWEVALLCDDVDVPPDWYQRVSSGLREHAAAAASTHQAQPIATPIVKTAPDTDLWNRMCGWAFILAGETRLRADESMRWWWLDTTMDFEARQSGGMVLVPGPIAVNRHPNGWTNAKPELAMQAARDREAFIARWGSAPW